MLMCARVALLQCFRVVWELTGRPGGGELLDKSFSHSNLRHIDFVSLSTNLMTYKKVNPLLSGFLVV